MTPINATMISEINSHMKFIYGDNYTHINNYELPDKTDTIRTLE